MGTCAHGNWGSSQSLALQQLGWPCRELSAPCFAVERSEPPQPGGEEKKQLTDVGDVSSHAVPHHERRKGKNDRKTLPFIDQQSVKYWKLSSPKAKINTSSPYFCTPIARDNLLLHPNPICSSYSRISHDKDQKINTILCHCALLITAMIFILWELSLWYMCSTASPEIWTPFPF